MQSIKRPNEQPSMVWPHHLTAQSYHVSSREMAFYGFGQSPASYTVSNGQKAEGENRDVVCLALRYSAQDFLHLKKYV
jgi:hypothetical protein